MNKAILMLLGLLALGLPQAGCRDQRSTDGDADGDGDGDGDTDGGGDADGDGDDDGFTPGCYPELGVCDPVARCGCGDGQYCDVEFQYDGVAGVTAEICVGDTGGTGVHGDECAAAACAPGNSCQADPTGGEVPLCAKWCIDDDDCAEYPGSRCGRELCYVDAGGNPIGCVEPYKLCTPEDVGLGAGTAEFSVCTGYEEDCPGNPPFTYTIGGSEVNGRCLINASTSPATLTFDIRDTEQGLSITANEVEFDLAEATSGTAEGSAGDRTRFTMIMPPDSTIYTTEVLASPPGRGYCDLQIHYREADLGFDLDFTCNHIQTAFTDFMLLTMDGDSMGPGTLSMDGCDVTL